MAPANFQKTLKLLACRSSHQRCSMKKRVVRNFAKFTEKHLCQGLWTVFLVFELNTEIYGVNFRNHSKKQKSPSLPRNLALRTFGRPATLLKKRLWHRCFPVNFAKFLRAPSYRTPLDGCFYACSRTKKLLRLLLTVG